MGSNLDRIFIVGNARDGPLVGTVAQAPTADSLRRSRLAALVGAVATLAAEGIGGSSCRGRSIAASVATAAVLRRSPSRTLAPLASRHRAECFSPGGIAAGGVALLTAFVPVLPQPSGPHGVGSETFRWTDPRAGKRRSPRTRATCGRSSCRRGIRPTPATRGGPSHISRRRADCPRRSPDCPSWMYRSFDEVNTHASRLRSRQQQ